MSCQRGGPRKERGFTLIELMTVVTVIGLLAVVAVPTFKGYLMQARETEGLIELAKIVDLEVVFTGLSIVGTYGGQTITCRPMMRFSPLIMIEDGVGWEPPQGKVTKTRMYYRGYEMGQIANYYGPTDGRCHSSFWQSGYPWALGVATGKTTAAADGWNTEYLAPSRFLVRAGPDTSIATTYSLTPSTPSAWPYDDTLTVALIADLDGVRPATASLVWVVLNMTSTAPTKTYYTWLMRSMYFDNKTGEVKVLPGIVRLPEK